MGIKGDGVIKTEDRPISQFSKLTVSGGYEIQWSSGKSSLKITADENLLPLIKTTVESDTLQIDSTENLRPSRRITVVLSSPGLAAVELTGGIRFQGSQLSEDSLKLESTGASDINIEGSVSNLVAELTGASHLNAKSLQSQNATLTLVGASDGDVKVAGALQVSITGAGSVTYSGNPKSVDQNITGAGRVRHEE